VFDGSGGSSATGFTLNSEPVHEVASSTVKIKSASRVMRLNLTYGCLCYYLEKIMIRPFRGVHPQIHPTAYVEPSAQVIGDVHLGEEASIWCNCTVRGDIHYIRIGDRSNVQDNSVLHVRNGTHPVILESEVTVGHSVTLHGCYVERGCLIGIGSILLDDVRIGELSLVAAGSLVSPGTIIPPRSLVMGSPAKVKRPLTDAEAAALEIFWKNYVEYTHEYRKEMLLNSTAKDA
jgi:carbonic anhydrase/acetyltransferase-like protein (isoleucine patch superfamily)